MPGVCLVLTGAETDDLGPLPCAVELPNTVLDVPPYAILARNEARHVGDAIAFVVADTLEHAKDDHAHRFRNGAKETGSCFPITRHE